METQPASPPRYSLIAMLLHWLIALSVIANWRIAEAAEHASKAEGAEIMGRHMALGMVILVLAVLRLIWRHVSPPPPLAAHLRAWEIALAKVTHSLFYILLLGLPLLGWVAMSAYGEVISSFGLFNWPALPIAQNKELAETIFEIHGTLGSVMVLLIGLHLLAVLKHTFIDRDGNLFRMLPFGRAKD